MSSSSSSTGSDSESEEAVIKEVTHYSSLAPGERLDCPTFDREDDEDVRVMVEHPAGSNLWYQYYYITESNNEIKLKIPARTKKNPARIEWIDKKSSRLSRIGLSTKLWKYVKASEGAWMPRGSKSPTLATDGAGRKPNRGKKSAASGRTGGSDGGKKREASSSVPNSDAEDTTLAGGGGGGEDAKAKNTAAAGAQKKKKSRLAPPRPPPAPPTKKKEEETRSFSSSSDSDSEGEEEEKKSAAMLALAEWFQLHDKALSLKLAGTNESRGLQVEIEQQKVTGKGKEITQNNGGSSANAAAAAAVDKTKLSRVGSEVLSHGSGGGGGFGTAVGVKRKFPSKQPHRLLSLQEDDLFGGGGGGAAKKSSLKNMGSGHLSPMNSLGQNPGGRKEGGVGGDGGGGTSITAAAAAAVAALKRHPSEISHFSSNNNNNNQGVQQPHGGQHPLLNKNSKSIKFDGNGAPSRLASQLSTLDASATAAMAAVAAVGNTNGNGGRVGQLKKETGGAKEESGESTRAG